MTIRITTPETDTELEDLITKALGKDWAKRAASKLREIEEDTEAQIEYELEDRLKESIRDKAERLAGGFIFAIARGDWRACNAFIGDPPGYQNWQRRKLGEFGVGSSSYTCPVALRREMIMACADKLVHHWMLDMQAEIEQLRAQLDKQKAELIKWRLGEMVCGT